MALITLSEAPAVEIPGIIGRPLAVPSRGSTQLAVWALEVAPGITGQPHTVDREEVFVLQAGHLQGTVGAEEFELAVGDALLVPPDTLFSIRNSGDETACLTVCTTAGIRATINGQVVEPGWAQ